jgi:hypothetical protein
MTREAIDRIRRSSLPALLALAAVAGCADDGGGSADDATPTTDPVTRGTTVEPVEGCAWGVRADEDVLNIAYPDTAATYWSIAYDLAPGEALELRATYPAARYASYISYGPNGGAIDVLTDRDIVPDDGSTNPFAGDPDVAGPHDYTVVISGDRAAADDPNVLGAAPDEDREPGVPATSPTTAAADAGTSSTTSPTSTDAGGTTATTLATIFGSGGDGAVQGSTLLRVYVPDDEDDPAGGVALPSVTLVASDGTRQAVATCETSGPSPRAVELVEANGPPTDRPAPPQPVFVRPEAGAARLFPNPDNVYIATIVEHRPGRVVVVQGRAPTHPDAAAGRPVGGDEQVRYWSLCTNEYRKPYPVSSCVIDRDVVLDDEGRYTFVISTPEDRPTNATASEGVTWLDWGSTEVNNLLLMRHMLASPDFPESAIGLEPGSLASAGMGDYAPVGTYCDTATFETGGAPACAPE